MLKPGRSSRCWPGGAWSSDWGGVPEGALELSARPHVLFHCLELVLGRNRVRVGLQPLGGKRRTVELAAAHIARQQSRRPRQTLGGRRAPGLQRRPVRFAEVAPVVVRRIRRIGDVAQQVRIVDAGEAGQPRGRGEPPEAQVRNRKIRCVVRGEQRRRGRVPLRVPPAPVVHDPHRVRVRLRIHSVDDQHPAVVLLEECRVAREGGVSDVSGPARLVALGPVVDDRFARGVGLGVAEARGVPAPVRLDEHEELAPVVGGVNNRQTEPRGRDPGTGGQQALQERSPLHAASPHSAKNSPVPGCGWRFRKAFTASVRGLVRNAGEGASRPDTR